jgi:outer membrane protein assembly factor BamB/uncharacterized cupredoxin-like copper-binding protein
MVDEERQATTHATVVSRRRLLVGATAFAVAGLSAGLGLRGPVTQAQNQGPIEPNPLGSPIPEEVTQAASDWPLVHGDYKAHRNGAGATISTENIGDIDITWRAPLTAAGYYGAITSPAIVLGETIFFQDGESNVFAVDRTTGDLKWEHVFSAVNFGPSGVSIGYGMIYGGTGPQGEVFALNAETGEEVWRHKLSISADGATVMAPTVYDNVVYTCLDEGYRGGARGFLYALDAKTGAVLWRWDTSTDNLWGAARLNGGAGIWYPASVDDAGHIYFGTGNPAPFPANNGETRPGPNLYSSSMVSLDVTTGSVRWYVQAAPHDVLDHDFQQTPILATITDGDTERLLAIGAGKVGTVIAADAITGRVVWEKRVGEHNEYGDGAPLPATPVVVLPGTYGGVESPMALANDTLFVPVLNLPSTFSATEWVIPEGQTLADARSELIALDVHDGSEKWKVAIDTFVAAGATVANDIVFTGGLDGVVHGYNIETGEEVWTYQANGGLNAPFSVSGDMLFVPVGSPIYKKSGEVQAPQTEMIAFRIGGNESGTPVVQPALPHGASPSEATPVTEPAPPPAAATPEGAAGAAVTVTMVDLAFEPKAFSIPADTPTRVSLPNAGALPHNFSIEALKISVDAAPGATGEVTINAPAGTYEYYCNVPGHRDAGMVGTLTVS